MLASPDPTYTTLGSDGATAIDPMDAVGWSSKTGFHSWPPFVDFQTPPEAVAAKYVRGSPATPATRATRPPMNGPRRRSSTPFSGSLSGEGFPSSPPAGRAAAQRA